MKYSGVTAERTGGRRGHCEQKVCMHVEPASPPLSLLHVCSHIGCTLCTCVCRPTTAIFLKNGYHLRPSFSPQFTISGESAADGGEHALLNAIPSRRPPACTPEPGSGAGSSAPGVGGSLPASAQHASGSNDAAGGEVIDDDYDNQFNFNLPSTSVADNDNDEPDVANDAPAKVVHVIPTPNPAPLHLGGGSSRGSAHVRSSPSIASAIEGLGQSLVTAMRDTNDRLVSMQAEARMQAELQRAHEKQLVEQCHPQ